MSMDELLATSDVISILCPLTEETRHLISHPVRAPTLVCGCYARLTADPSCG